MNRKGFMLRCIALPIAAAVGIKMVPKGAEWTVSSSEGVSNRVFYVNANAMPGGDGTFDRPHKTIDDALAHSNGCSGTLMVAPGVYDV